MNHVIIDTDPGIDDVHAILIALAHPSTHVEVRTTLAGNVLVYQTTTNALTILDIFMKKGSPCG